MRVAALHQAEGAVHIGVGMAHAVIGVDEGRLHKRRLDVLAPAARGPGFEGGEHADEAQHGRTEDPLGDGVVDRAVAPVAVLDHELTALGRHDALVGPHVGIAALGSEPGDREHYESRVERRERRPVGTESLSSGRAEVLDHHVAVAGERMECRSLLCGAQVESVDPLPPVPLAVRGDVIEGSAHRRLDADDGGAVVGEHHADQRRLPGGEIEHADAVAGERHPVARVAGSMMVKASPKKMGELARSMKRPSSSASSSHAARPSSEENRSRVDSRSSNHASAMPS